MVPSSLRITSGEPAFAQAVAHSALIGFFNSFVNAHAESSTYPFTEIDRAAPVEAKAITSKMQLNTSLASFFGVMFSPHANDFDGNGTANDGQQRRFIERLFSTLSNRAEM